MASELHPTDETNAYFQPTPDPNLLDHYFLSVYNKLEADALLFNRQLPHNLLIGTENEAVLANLLRQFLPPTYGVDTGIVIDRHGNRSRQADIIIYDSASFPRYFRRVYPVELVYGVIEVKTVMTKTAADESITNLTSLFGLDFRPHLTPYWQNRAAKEEVYAEPPFGMVFSFRSEAAAFETWARWFPWEAVHKGMERKESIPRREIRTITVASLDKGLIKMESSNGYVQRWLPIAVDGQTDRAFSATVCGRPFDVDPAKSLFLFLETLWQRLHMRQTHPGFDIRTYMSTAMGSVMEIDDDHMDVR